MNKQYKHISLLAITLLFLTPSSAQAKSVRGHIFEMSRSVYDAVKAPITGIFVDGPKRMYATYQYEVHGREKEEKRNLFRYKLFAIWRAPGEEVKAIIDGCTQSVEHLGTCAKEGISVFFSD